MSKIPQSTASFLTITLAFTALFSGGCADMITYSRQSQREGMRLYAEANYADAAGAFKNSVRQNPQNYEGHYYLGNCYEKLNQSQQAIAAYRSARQTIGLTVEGRYDDDIHQKILNGIASTIARSDPRNIELDATQQEASTQASADSWFILAKVYAIRGDPDSAVDAFNRASLLEPKNFFVHKDFGLYLEKIGQSQRADATLRRAYSLNNQDAEVIAALRRMGVIPGPSLAAESRFGPPPPPSETPKSTGSNGSVQVPRD